RFSRDWSSDVCSSDLPVFFPAAPDLRFATAFLRSAVAVFFLMPTNSAAPLTTCTAASPTAERRSASRASLRRSSHSLQLTQLPRSEERRAGKESQSRT